MGLSQRCIDIGLYIMAVVCAFLIIMAVHDMERTCGAVSRVDLGLRMEPIEHGDSLQDAHVPMVHGVVGALSGGLTLGVPGPSKGGLVLKDGWWFPASMGFRGASVWGEPMPAPKGAFVVPLTRKEIDEYNVPQ
jgi:hypothetical protein